MESTRRLRRDLGYEVAKLHGLQQTFDRAPDDASSKALATQIRVQAGVCLKVLDDYQSSVGSRMWSDAERMCRPFRDQLRRTESQFRTNAGEWDGGTRSRSSLQRTGHWVWDDFVESTDDAVAVAGDEFPEVEATSQVMVAPPLQAASHLHDDLDLLLALFDDEEERNGAKAKDATSDVIVASPVRAKAHPRRNLATPAAFVGDEEPGATANDATLDVVVAPPVPAEAGPHEDLDPPTAFVDDEEPEVATAHEDLDPPTAFVDDEEPGATANDATSDVIVAPPVPAEVHPHEDLDPPTAFVDDEEPEVATAHEDLDPPTAFVDDEEREEETATDATLDVLVAPPVPAEAHPHEDLDPPTAFVDDEEPEAATEDDLLRFTLPMGRGSGEQTMLVLVPSKTGLVYGHQYGGQQCRCAEVEGFLVPAWVNPEARAEFDQLFLTDLRGKGVRDEDRPEAVERVRELVQQIWYRGTGDRMAPLHVDDARAEELNEAWVPVLTPDGPAYLAWSNSD